MKQIEVNVDVFAAIWASHQPGEVSEDSILRRILKVQPSSTKSPVAPPRIGITDPRFDIKLPEGFEIFRVYKGIEYRAKAVSEHWLLASNGKVYPTVNQLSRAVTGKVENAWRNWYFMGSDGQRHLVEGIRKDIKPNVRHLAPLIL